MEPILKLSMSGKILKQDLVSISSLHWKLVVSYENCFDHAFKKEWIFIEVG